VTIPLKTMTKINDDLGKYILLKDYGSEGISVAGQYDDLGEALAESSGSDWAIVNIVRVAQLAFMKSSK
jgi:hypothetical protein